MDDGDLRSEHQVAAGSAEERPRRFPAGARVAVVGVAGAWVAAALTAAVVLGASGATPGRWPEEAHLVGHLGLCGVLAVLLAESLHLAPLASARSVRRLDPAAAALGALAATVLFGAAIEAVQLRHGPHWTEVLYDLLTDTVGATAGLVVWAQLSRARREPVGHALSAALHPLWVAPVGLAMALYAAERSGGVAVRWTAAATLCLAPALGFWVLGIARGWWSDPDLSRRADRPSLYAVSCAGAAAFGSVALWTGPEPVLDLAALCAAGAVLGAALTVAGLKVSGHVTVPAALGLAMVEWSARGPWVLLAVAAILSWARVAARRHRRVEVAAGWALASAVTVGLTVLRS